MDGWMLCDLCCELDKEQKQQENSNILLLLQYNIYYLQYTYNIVNI